MYQHESPAEYASGIAVRSAPRSSVVSRACVWVAEGIKFSYAETEVAG